MSSRYIVKAGSTSGHCCFEATVLDTSKTHIGEYASLCECLWAQDAERICEAMNRAADDGGAWNPLERVHG